MNTNFYGETKPRIERIFGSAAVMRYAERVMIYALVLGMEPERVLEIGTAYGGTAWVIVQALDDVGNGHLVCVDPKRTWEPEIEQAIRHRATLVKGASPDALAECASVAGGRFDLVLVDGDHDEVLADVAGVMDYLNAGGRLVFHDWHHPPVCRAIQDSLTRFPELSDGGRLTVAEIPNQGKPQGGLYTLVRRS